MKITIDLDKEIWEQLLEYGIIKGWEDCGCSNCKKLVEVCKNNNVNPYL